MAQHPAGRSGHHRIKDLFVDYATGLIAKVVVASDLFDDSEGALTDVAQDALRFFVDLPIGHLPDELPDGLRDKIEYHAQINAELDPDELLRALHDAFTVAGAFVSKGAFARRIAPGVMNHYVEVLQRLEHLIATVLVEANDEERSRLEYRSRFIRASALYELLPDPVVESAAAADLARSGDDPAAVHDPFVAAGLAELGPVVAVVVRPTGSEARLPRVHDLPEASLAALSPDESVIVLPHARVDRLSKDFAVLFGASWASIGLPTTLDDVASSLAWARRAQDLREDFAVEELAGRDGARDIVACDELPVAMLIGADRQLLRLVRARVLAPFRGLSTFRRTILLETLAAWAKHPGAGAPAIARTLDKHPQTIRYRLKQLRDLLGDDMDDPQTMLLIRLMFVLEPRP